MSDLVARYIRHVGRHLPKRERAEIEAELRSQIGDALDDRGGDALSEAEVAAVLAEFGDPRRLAASYRGDQYLVGPALYPTMLMILRHGWLIVPSIVVFLYLFGLLIAAQPLTWFAAVLELGLAILGATLIFSAVVVLFFAALERTGEAFDDQGAAFDPASLPEVNDPSAVDRAEATFGVAIGLIILPLLLYFLAVGGLTARFNLANPGEIIAVPDGWLILLIVAIAGMIAINLGAMRRGRWTARWWLAETLLELLGAVGLYFVLYEPIATRLIAGNPALADAPLVASIPEIIVVVNAILIVAGRGTTLVALWGDPGDSSRSEPV
jgi:hypothetical protein